MRCCVRLSVCVCVCVFVCLCLCVYRVDGSAVCLWCGVVYVCVCVSIEWMGRLSGCDAVLVVHTGNAIGRPSISYSQFANQLRTPRSHTNYPTTLWCVCRLTSLFQPSTMIRSVHYHCSLPRYDWSRCISSCLVNRFPSRLGFTGWQQALAALTPHVTQSAACL